MIARPPGLGGGRTLLCGHPDTVSVDGMTEPHDPRVDGDRLYGRGAYDMKAGLAAALIAARGATRAGLAGDVVVACARASACRRRSRHLSADAAIVTEPPLDHPRRTSSAKCCWTAAA